MLNGLKRRFRKLWNNLSPEERPPKSDADKLKEITKICSVYSQDSMRESLARTAMMMIIDVITEDYV